MKKILFSLILLLTGSQATQVNPMICGPVMDSMKKDGPNVLASVDRVKATYEKEKEKYQYTNDNAKVRAAFDTFCQSKFMTDLARKQRNSNKYVTKEDLSDKKPACNYMKNILNHAYKALGIKPENQLPLYSLEEISSREENVQRVTVGLAGFEGIYINEKFLMNNREHFTIYHEASHVKYNDLAISVLLSKFPESKLKTFFEQKLFEYKERRADLSALTIMKCGYCSEKLGRHGRCFSGKDYLNQEQIYAIAEQQKKNGKICVYHDILKKGGKWV